MSKKLFLTFFAAIALFSAYAQDTFTGTGNWNNAGNWSAGIPAAGTNVVINGTVTVNSAGAVANNVTISGGGTLILSGQGLTVGGNWTNNGTFSAPDNNPTSENVTFTGSGTTIGGSSITSFLGLTINPGAGNTVTLISSTINIGGPTNTFNGGEITLQSGTFDVGAGHSINLIGQQNTTIQSSGGNFKSYGPSGWTLEVGVAYGATLSINGTVTLDNVMPSPIQTSNNGYVILTNTVGSLTTGLHINGVYTVTGPQSPSWKINGDAPVWGPSSTLYVDAQNGSFNISNLGQAWLQMASGTIGTTPGYPNNVTLLDMGASAGDGVGWEPSGVIGINGALQLGTATTTVATGGRADFKNITNFTSGGIVIDNNSLLIGQPTATTFVDNGNFILEGATVGIYQNSGDPITFSGSGTMASPQIIETTSGTFSSLSNITVSNGTYVQLQSPLSVPPTSTVTLTSGIIETSSTNTLTLNNNSPGAITSGGATSFINGPLSWSLPNTATAFTFPIGVKTGATSTYLPMTVTPNSTSGSTVTATAFTGNAGGTPDATVTSLSTTEYWSLAASPAFTSSASISVTRQGAVIPGANALAKSSTVNGTYSAIGGVGAGNTITGASFGTSSSAFLVIAVAPLNVLFVSSTDVTCTTSGSLTVTGSGGTAPYTYSVGGAYFANGGVFNPLAAGTYTVTAKDASGTISTPITVRIAYALHVSNDTTICSLGTANLTAVNTLNVSPSYSWSVNASGIPSFSTSANVSVSPAATTTYYVTSKLAENLLANPGFESGLGVGFTTQYGLQDVPYTFYGQNPNPAGIPAWPPAHDGIYNVGNGSGQLCSCFATPVGSGGGFQMPHSGNSCFISDGPNNGAPLTSYAWQEQVNVVAGTTYIFSFWLGAAETSAATAAPLSTDIRTQINGVTVSDVACTPTWAQTTVSWVAPVTGLVPVTVYDNYSSDNGNDFALDDMAFIDSCSVTAPVTVTVGAAATPGAVNPTPQTICVGSNPASDLTLTGNSGTVVRWEYSTDIAFVAPAGTPIANTTTTLTKAAVGGLGLAAGTYYFRAVTNACAGTVGSTPAKIIVSPLPTLTITNPAAVCSPATVDLTAAAVTAGSTGGTTLTYYTDPGATLVLASPNTVAASGTYYIKSTTAAGCSVVQPVTATINPTPTLTITNPAAVCSPSTVDITAAAVTAGSTGGTTLTYYTNAAATIVLAGPNAVAASGTYYIKSTPAVGCSVVKPVTVTINPLPTLTITNPAAVCSPSTVDITAAAVTAGSTGGTTLTYYTNAAATIVLAAPNAVAASGTYYIKSTTASGCSVVQPVTVTINPTPTLTITNPAAVCSPSTVDITAAAVTAGSTGGTTLTYYTNAAATIVLAGPNAVAASGTYYIKSTTAAGCNVVQPVTVTINPTPTLTITNPAAVCSPSTVDITAAAVTAGSTGGTTLTYYTNAAATIVLAGPNAVAASGTYYIKSATAAGCNVVKPVVVTINPTPTLTITNPAAVCSPSTVDITAAAVTAGSTGGTTLTYYTNAAATIVLAGPNAVAASGTYYIKSTTAVGCNVVQPVTVTINPTPTLTITNPAAVCSPSTVDITAAAVTAGSTGGTTLTYYTNAAATIVLAGPNAVAASGTYYIKSTTAAGCNVVKPVTVTINATPSITVTSTNPTTCATSTGTFTVNGLTPAATYTINFDKAGVAQAPQILVATAGGTVTVTTLPAGSYTFITATSAAGCISNTGIATLSDPAAPTPTAGTLGAVCSGNTLSLTSTPTAGASYSWSGPNGFTSTLQNPTVPAALYADSGSYTVTVTLTGCTGSSTVDGVVHPTPVLTITNPAAICAPGGVDITAAAVTAGSTLPSGTVLSYYTNAAATIVLAAPTNVTTSGTYYIKALTGSGCSVVNPVTVTINAQPSITVSSTNPTTCATSTGTFTVSGLTPAATYTINFDKAGVAQAPQILVATAGGTVTVTTLPAGSYTVITATSAAGCISNAGTATLSDPAAPTPTAGTGGPVCSGNTLSLTSTPTAGASYSWSGPNGFTSILQNPTVPAALYADSGSYTVTVTLAGCAGSSIIDGVVHPTPVLTITNPAAVCAPGGVDITAAAVTAGSTLPSGTVLSYYTNAAATIVLALPTNVTTSGTYYIKALTGSGCSV
ncbi:MAG TPA: hypothetical protein VNZ45_00055, partial [Bacteroidia bacterium]|nr:hypothetical protein [Bacteroidia bacterium]